MTVHVSELRLCLTAAVTLLDVGRATLEIAPPTHTPWDSRNSRLDGPAGLQLTLFTDA